MKWMCSAVGSNHSLRVSNPKVFYGQGQIGTQRGDRYVRTKRLSRPGSGLAFAGELAIGGQATQMIDNLVGREEK